MVQGFKGCAFRNALQEYGSEQIRRMLRSGMLKPPGCSIMLKVNVVDTSILLTWSAGVAVEQKGKQTNQTAPRQKHRTAHFPERMRDQQIHLKKLQNVDTVFGSKKKWQNPFCASWISKQCPSAKTCVFCRMAKIT